MRRNLKNEDIFASLEKFLEFANLQEIKSQRYMSPISFLLNDIKELPEDSFWDIWKTYQEIQKLLGIAGPQNSTISILLESRNISLDSKIATLKDMGKKKILEFNTPIDWANTKLIETKVNLKRFRKDYKEIENEAQKRGETNKKELIRGDATKENSIGSQSKQNAYYITKDREGNYYREGKLISVPNKDTLYYILFDVVYNLISEGGLVTYEEIEKSLRKRKVKSIKITPMQGAARNKRIQNNLTDNKNGFFRYASIDNEVVGGKELIKVERTKGIRFNNKK